MEKLRETTHRGKERNATTSSSGKKATLKAHGSQHHREKHSKEKSASVKDPRNRKKKFLSKHAIPVCDLLFSKYRYLVQHQLESDNQCMEEKIPRLFGERQIFSELIHDDKKYTNYFTFTDGAYMPPMTENDNTPLMPLDALIGSSYMVSCMYHVEQYMDVTDLATGNLLERRQISTEPGRMNIGNIPIMVRSNLCNLTRYPTSEKQKDESPYNLGGFYIINGQKQFERIAFRFMPRKMLVP
jgi:DNA-directed RNA polymerase beta subunit